MGPPLSADHARDGVTLPHPHAGIWQAGHRGRAGIGHALATVATQLLLDWNRGNEQARDQMLPLVYSELRRLARAFLARERFDHTLQATALVHEAYLRLIDQRQVDWKNRAQFVGVAAVMMRRILVNHGGRRTRETIRFSPIINGCHQPMAAVVRRPAATPTRQDRSSSRTVRGRRRGEPGQESPMGEAHAQA